MKLSDLRDNFHPSWSIVLEKDKQPYVGRMVDEARALSLDQVRSSEDYAAFVAEFPGWGFVPEDESELKRIKDGLLGAPFEYADGAIQQFLAALSAPETTEGVTKDRSYNDSIYTFSYVGTHRSNAYMAARELQALDIVWLQESPVTNFLDVLSASEHDLSNARYFLSDAAADGDEERLQRYLRSYRALAAAWGRPQDRETLGLNEGLLSLEEAAEVEQFSRFLTRTVYGELGKEVWAHALLGLEEEMTAKLLAPLWEHEVEAVREQLALLERRREKGYRMVRDDAVEEARLRLRAFTTHWLFFGENGERVLAQLAALAR